MYINADVDKRYFSGHATIADGSNDYMKPNHIGYSSFRVFEIATPFPYNALIGSDVCFGMIFLG